MRPARPFFEPSATQSQFEFETPDHESISPRFFFCAAIMRADPKSAKKTYGLNVFFVLLGSKRVKAARRMLVKLKPRV